MSQQTLFLHRSVFIAIGTGIVLAALLLLCAWQHAIYSSTPPAQPHRHSLAELTINPAIQQKAEQELTRSIEATHALGGQCLVMNPTTGELLAYVLLPKGNLAHKQPALPIDVDCGYFEPGGTFDIMPVVAALEEGVARDGQTITNCTSAMSVGNHVIHEAHHAHGKVDLQRILTESCNIGCATLALKLGPVRFRTWCEKMGFGKRTGLEISHECPGTLNFRNMHSRITLANMGFGQSLAVTPQQLLATYAVVANGGEWVQPRLLKATVKNDATAPAATARRRVCSEKTAALLRSYLEDVVKHGTGKQAAIPGYRIAGKTGTSQKAFSGGYRAGAMIATFAGIMPVDQPRLVILVIVDEPHSSYYGGVVAAPVAREVGRFALKQMGITPVAHR